MQKLIIVLVFLSTFLTAEYLSPSEQYCYEYKQQALYYFNKGQKKDYLYERYILLYKDFKWKHEKCLEEYVNGNHHYQGYKTNPYQQRR
jgi:hypothetical protein